MERAGRLRFPCIPVIVTVAATLLHDQIQERARSRKQQRQHQQLLLPAARWYIPGAERNERPAPSVLIDHAGEVIAPLPRIFTGAILQQLIGRIPEADAER